MFTYRLIVIVLSVILIVGYIFIGGAVISIVAVFILWSISQRLDDVNNTLNRIEDAIDRRLAVQYPIRFAGETDSDTDDH